MGRNASKANQVDYHPRLAYRSFRPLFLFASQGADTYRSIEESAT